MGESVVKEWTRLIGSYDYHAARSVSAATDGSVYIAGITLANVNNPPDSYSSGFLDKYNSDGSREWTQLIESGPYHLYCCTGDVINSVSAGTEGSVYVSGTIVANALNEFTNSYDWRPRTFLTKYDEDGGIVWSEFIDQLPSSRNTPVATDSYGSVYLAGRSWGPDVVLIKYDEDGIKQWERQLGSSIDVNSVGTSPDGSSVYIAGVAFEDLDGQINSGESDAFLSKYNSDGSREWTRLLGTTAPDRASSVSAAADGSIYLAGATRGDFDEQTRSRAADAFLSKYNSDGSQEWTQLLGSSFLWGFGNSVSVPLMVRSISRVQHEQKI